MERYGGRQYVGIDLHKGCSVIVRMTPSGERIGPVAPRASALVLATALALDCPIWT